MTAPTPVPDPTGKRARLTASRAALSLAVAAAIAAGVLLSPTPPPPPPVTPPVATATGCSMAMPGAVVVRFADQTPAGTVARADIQPVVICGPKAIALAMQTYVQWVAAGPCPCFTGGVRDTTSNPYDKVVLSPADTAKMWDSVVVTRVDSTHWSIPDTSAIRWKGLGQILYNVMGAANVPTVTDDTPTPVTGWWSYVPVAGGMLRVVLSTDKAIVDTASVVKLTMTRAGPLEPLSAGGAGTPEAIQ